MLPAIWNRFPLLQYDTGGYLARWYEGTLVVSRGVAYGLLLNAGVALDFWPVVIVQSATAVWVLALVLRVHALARPAILLTSIAGLSVFSTLPWLTSILLTDIFAGLSVLALHLVVLRGDRLRCWERRALILLIGYSAATHSATFAVLLMLLAAAAIACLRWRGLLPRDGLRRGAAAMLLGVSLVFAANGLVAHRLAWTPGGFALSFGRMLQDGIVARYLHDHCPDPRLRLCAHQSELPRDADVFFWGSDLFDRLGRFAGLGAEMKTIALESLADYPWMQAKAATVAAVRQLFSFATGEGVLTTIWHTYAIVKHDTPQAVPAMLAARQQQGELHFAIINRVHVPVALVSMIVVFALAAIGWGRPGYADLSLLTVTVLLALLANAAVCGVLSNPHDRYGARMIWLVVLVATMLPWRMLKERGIAVLHAPRR